MRLNRKELMTLRYVLNRAEFDGAFDDDEDGCEIEYPPQFINGLRAKIEAALSKLSNSR